MVNRVVVVFTDGRRLRGFVYDVSTERGDFHLYASEDAAESKSEIVRLADCKAICFVKTFAGNPNYRENKTELTGRVRWGRAYEVVFGDGERIVGAVETYHPKRQGFYIIPPDPRSNSLRIFVVAANAKSIRCLDQKTGDGQDGVWEAPDPTTYPVNKRNELVLRLLRDPDAAKLAREVYIEPAILEHWKAVFLDAGHRALADPALDASRVPVEKRLDIVLRLFAREDQAVLSQVSLVPFRLMADWRERFLDAGERALREHAGEEGGVAPETLKARYEKIVADAAASLGKQEDFLDSLSGLFDDPPPA